MQPAHPFAGNAFNRLAERRDDVQWLNALFESATARILPVWNGRVLVSSRDNLPRMISIAPTLITTINNNELILLGEFRGEILFASALSSDSEPLLQDDAAFHDLRSISGLLDREELALLGYARALAHWRNTHRYCGRCGSLNHLVKAGHVMECSNAMCKQQTFPRLDPAVIVLITDGERVLLGRQARFPPQRYSTIAGFVEWAESIEEAVAREVREETGVTVDEVQYHSSQPWPFPSSLMLGFIAHAATTDITLADKELEDARWFTRADLANGIVHLPPTQSISFALIEDWYNLQAMRPLREEPRAAIDTAAQLFRPT
ncbi:MAG TPA: NAD(+) diphosphatase [Steroidobacteraceae bacterium]|nr:NAD(+) diphosphatase [Steroidobacteraceae bacterium]